MGLDACERERRIPAFHLDRWSDHGFTGPTGTGGSFATTGMAARGEHDTKWWDIMVHNHFALLCQSFYLADKFSRSDRNAPTRSGMRVSPLLSAGYAI